MLLSLTQQVVRPPVVDLVELPLVPDVLCVQAALLLIMHPLVQQVASVRAATVLVPLLTVRLVSWQQVATATP